MITDQIQLEVAVEQIESEQISMSVTAMVYIMSPVQQIRYYQALMELPTHQLTSYLPITLYNKYNRPLEELWDPGEL